MLLTTRIAVHRGAKKIRRVSRLFTENHKKHPNKTTSSERASLGGLGIGALAGTLGSLAGMGGGFVSNFLRSPSQDYPGVPLELIHPSHRFDCL